MNQNINVVCLKWGDTLYNASDVNKLFAGVTRNTTIPFNFHCFTENPEGIHPDVIIHPLKYDNIDGWWNKLYLFSDEIDIDGRIFFIDLDTLITGNIDDIMSWNEGFVVLRDFFTGIAKCIDSDEYVGSGVMSFNAKEHTEIWNTFIENPTAVKRALIPHGDQRHIQNVQTERLYWQDLFPDQVISFKVHCNKGHLPEGGKIVCYHGKPNIPDSITKRNQVPHFIIPPSPWVAEYWKELDDSSTEHISEFWKSEGLDHVKPRTLRGEEFTEGWDPRPVLLELLGSNSINDIGCGYGRISTAFNPNNYNGYDINTNAVIKAAQENPEYRFSTYDNKSTIPKSYSTLFYTVLLHIHDNDIIQFLRRTTNGTTLVVVAELLGRRWRRNGNPPVFNREYEDYVNIFKLIGFTVKDRLDKNYEKYGADISFLSFVRT